MPSTAVKERPIIFSAQSVRAILAGSKTQTRRVIVRQPPTESDEVFFWHNDARVIEPSASQGLWARKHSTDVMDGWLMHIDSCPFGVPGDRLWLRETWATHMARKHPWYRADGEVEGVVWKSPIHMPRRASRITLEITDVRVQRVQEISAQDIVAEGWPFSSDRDAFAAMWDKLNAKRGHGWEANPWVWAITFRRIEE